MNYVYLSLLSLAFLCVEFFAGGTRLIYSLPAYALLGVAALATVFSAARPVKIRPDAACLVSSAIFFGYILARCLYSPVGHLALDDFYMVLGSVAVYLLTALYFVKSRYRMMLIGLLLAIALAQVAVGLVQFAQGRDFVLFGYPWDANANAAGANYFFKIFLGIHRFPAGSRASGQYISPNHLAGYLEAVGIIGMSLVFWSTWKPWAKILAGYVSALSFAGVIITVSRGGYISSAFCILVFCTLGITVIKIAYPERLTRVVLIGGAVLLLIAGSLPFVITSSVVRARAGEILEKNMRFHMWAAALQEVKLEPVLGTGSGTYLYYGRKFRDPSVQLDPVRVHNDYLDLLAEYGLAGMAGFLLFLAAHLRNGLHTFFWLVRKRLQFSADWRSSSLALNIGCLCAVAAYMVHSVVDFNLHIPANAMLMAFVFGMLANPGLETSHEKKAEVKTSRAFQFVLPALGLVILAAGLPKLPGEWYAEKARVALRDKQYLDAKLAAEEGIEWEKKNPDLYYYLGESERNVGDLFPVPALAGPFYQAASDAFKKGLELFPEDENLLLIEGWTLDVMGRHEEAGGYFQQAVDWDPNSEVVRQYEASHMDYLKAAEQSPPAS